MYRVMSPGEDGPYGGMDFAEKRPDGQRWDFMDRGVKWEDDGTVHVKILGDYFTLGIYKLTDGARVFWIIERARLYEFPTWEDAARNAREALKAALNDAPDDVKTER